MEFNEKLQELRKKSGMTQEELAQKLYVSRAAISKWESGRGYPNIDSLKALARCFSVSIDAMLSGDEVLTIAQEEHREKESRMRDLVFGLLDMSSAMFFFLPLLGQQNQGVVQEVSLLSLSAVGAGMKAAYFVMVFAIILTGMMILALGNACCAFWQRSKMKISLGMNAAAVFLFIISRQPYAAGFLFVFLIIKMLMLIKWP